MKRRIMLLCVTGVTLMFCGCGEEPVNGIQESVAAVSDESTEEENSSTLQQTQTDEGVNESMAEAVGVEDNISVWPVYWDSDTVMTELEAMQNKVDTICYFAAYFDIDHIPFIPEETLQNKQQVESEYGDKKWNTYLTFVNDVRLADGSSSLKDTDLLYDLLEEPQRRAEHIDTILNMVTDNGFQGIEIDYEAIKKDMELWKLFAVFTEELNTKAETRGIAVRILLESNVPIDSIQFPEGPEYVVMCYNLYGYGTEPGPKADKAFLIEMAGVLDQLPAPGNMALSLGGFDFASDGSVTQLTERECVDILNASGSTVSRDNDSQDVVFQYQTSDGLSHEVWYADDTTLQYWISIGKSCGYDRFSIWRLGRNVTLK